MTDQHSCSYHCTRPACVLAQRDELRDSHGAGNQVPPTARTTDADRSMAAEIRLLREALAERDDELARLRAQEPVAWNRMGYEPVSDAMKRAHGGMENWTKPLYAAPPAQPADITNAEHVCAQAYQVVGSLLDDLGQFNAECARKILDNLSSAKIVHDDVLPWPSFEHPAARPVQPQGWVSVQERMPPGGIPVIADTGQKFPITVIAWMPLPARPRDAS